MRAQPGARVERGVELVELRADPHDGLLLELRQPDGTLRHIRAAFVIGADGIHSTVRRELGIAFGGEEGIDTGLAVHFRAPLWDLLGEHRYAVYFLTSEPEGRALVPVGRPDRWALSLPWEAGRETPSLESAWLEEQVWAAAGVADMPVEFDSVSVVDYAVAIAERFRDGNAFLIGDAAHRVTPRGATGLNTAIRDGFDLGWKLAWVLLGWGDDPLLDTYEVERRPVAEFNTARSSRCDGSQLASATGLQADIGGRIPHVWVAREDGLVSTLDLLGEGLTLFIGPEWNEPVRGLGEDGPPLSVQRLDAIAARGLGLGPAGSVLVRPDGHPLSLSNPGIGPFSAPLGSFATRSRRNSPQRVG